MLTCMCFNTDPYRLYNGVEDTGLSPHKPTFLIFVDFFVFSPFVFNFCMSADSVSSALRTEHHYTVGWIIKNSALNS